jgi:hypothetical protein
LILITLFILVGHHDGLRVDGDAAVVWAVIGVEDGGNEEGVGGAGSDVAAMLLAADGDGVDKVRNEVLFSVAVDEIAPSS